MPAHISTSEDMIDMMDHYQLVAGLALKRLWEDDGSGPPPVVGGHEADRRASLAASRPASGSGSASASPLPEASPGRRRRGGVRRGRGGAPATVT
ncbi:hypothetical protein [Streptomyces sp. 6N223]|uniref:hypothetical protein n=1 Tax=Streptomyces sp. 6N223 TaxID=3457412 RepID=UPI003FD5C8C9